jgi:hypothetical protein
MELALNGGEDYQLLFTLPRSGRRPLPKTLEGTKLTAIGEVTRDPRVVLVDSAGRAERLPPRGWDHLARIMANHGAIDSPSDSGLLCVSLDHHLHLR